MEERTLYEGGERTFALVCGTGDEAMEELRAFAERQGLSASRLTAIGASSSTTLGFLDWRTAAGGGPRAHWQHHAGRRQAGGSRARGGGPGDGTTMGGHLLRGVVPPTLEAVLEESPAPLWRRHGAEPGLALIAPRLGVGAR